MNIKGILLDLDNTLYSYNIAHHAALKIISEKLKAWFGISFDESVKLYDMVRIKVNNRLKGTASCHNRLLYFQLLCEKIGQNPLIYALELDDIYWKTFYQNMVLFPGVIDFFKQFNHLPIALITNLTVRVQFQKIRKLQIADYINFIVTSEEVGCEKPDPLIFKYTLQKMNLRFNDVIMIGDDYEKDIKGAQNLNILSFLFDNQGVIKDISDKSTKFSDFTELSMLLKNILTCRDAIHCV